MDVEALLVVAVRPGDDMGGAQQRGIGDAGQRAPAIAAAGSLLLEKGPTPGSPAGSNGPTSCADRLIVLTLLPLRVQIRTRVSSGPDILLRTVPSRPARRGIVHDVRSSRV